MTEQNLVDRLVSVAEKIGFIEFDARNEHFKYGYASAAGMLKRLNTELSAVGVLATANEEVTHLQGSLAIVRCELTYHCGATGETLTCAGVGGGQDNGDKAVMKASTAAFKYAIAHSMMLGWAAEDPEDSSNDASVKTSSKARPKPETRTTPTTRSGGRAKSKKPEVSADEVKAAIEAADSAEELQKVMGNLVAFRGTSDYDDLRAAYKSRKEEVSDE